MPQDPLNYGTFINQRDYPHLARTSRALQRVGFPHLLDQFAPLETAIPLVLRMLPLAPLTFIVPPLTVVAPL